MKIRSLLLTGICAILILTVSFFSFLWLGKLLPDYQNEITQTNAISRLASFSNEIKTYPWNDDQYLELKEKDQLSSYSIWADMPSDQLLEYETEKTLGIAEKFVWDYLLRFYQKTHPETTEDAFYIRIYLEENSKNLSIVQDWLELSQFSKLFSSIQDRKTISCKVLDVTFSFLNDSPKYQLQMAASLEDVYSLHITPLSDQATSSEQLEQAYQTVNTSLEQRLIESFFDISSSAFQTNQYDLMEIFWQKFQMLKDPTESDSSLDVFQSLPYGSVQKLMKTEKNICCFFATQDLLYLLWFDPVDGTYIGFDLVYYDINSIKFSSLTLNMLGLNLDNMSQDLEDSSS